MMQTTSYLSYVLAGRKARASMNRWSFRGTTIRYDDNIHVEIGWAPARDMDSWVVAIFGSIKTRNGRSSVQRAFRSASEARAWVKSRVAQARQGLVVTFD